MKKKILIVDDDWSCDLTIKLFLTEKLFDVFLMNSYEQVYDFLKLDTPDIVLIDVLMKNEKGLEILRKIKQKTQNIPLIIISKAKNPLIIEKAFKCGAYDYLIKPMNFKDLNNKICYALNKKLIKRLHHV